LPVGIPQALTTTLNHLLCRRSFGNRQLTIPMYASPDNYIPQSGSNRRPLVMWFTVAAGSLMVMSLIVGAPLALNAGHPFWGLTIYRAFSYVCHQIPERSFFVEGHPFAVCARCTGLYVGFTVAVLAYPLVRSLRQTEAPPRKWLFIAAAPLAIDFTVGFLGIWNNTHFSRFATGALLGSVSVFYVMPGFMDLSLRAWRAKRKDSSRTTVNNVSPAEVLSANVSAPSDYSAPHRRI
jgi:uncharacterized membrane protein